MAATFVTVLDKRFVPFITAEQLRERVVQLGEELHRDFGERDPLVVCVLNGAFVFAADLTRAMGGAPEMAFVRLRSYVDTKSSGTVDTVMPLETSVGGRHVIIVEDIIDTGLTMQQFVADLERQAPATVTVVTLLTKPEARKYPLSAPLVVGFEIEDRFVVGYGLDYNGYGRTLPGIYQLDK